MNLKNIQFIFFMMAVLFLSGCGSMPNGGQMESYPAPIQEAEWIRSGEPIEFDGKQWYPQDGIENLLDSEIYLVGEYRAVQFFVEKTDVKPYNRLYTKFGRNRFRYFEVKKDDEKDYN